jgi:hypothetical protein
MSGCQMMLTNNVQQASAPLGIVTSDLQLYLNAADPASYPGSGTTWTDLSPNAYATTLVGSPTYSTTYFNFPNTSARYVDTNQSLASDNFSVGGWFRTSAGGLKMTVCKEQVGGWPWNYRIYYNGGQIVGDIAQSGAANQAIASPLTNYNNGSWYLVMFTRNTSTLKLYVNNTEVNSVANTLVGSITNSQELWIGRSAYVGAYQWVGDIGQVFIYNEVLTLEQIQQNYNATRATYGL